MRFPSALHNGEEVFLKTLQSKISQEELLEFFKEDGFNFPNDFPQERIREIISKKKFPTSDLQEFGWAIYECGFDRMRTYERYIRIFASSIYVYVRHVHEWGGDLQGEYCYLMVADSIKSGDAKELRLLATFFEWICTFVDSNNPINDYPLLISWLLIKYRLEEAQEDFVRVVEVHLKNHIEDQYLLIGDSYPFDVDDWLGLTEAIPETVGLDRNLLWDLIYRSDLQR